MSIHFPFDLEKAIEASALLVNLHSKPLESKTLNKLLFIAECISLIQSEQPIIGGMFIYNREEIIINELYNSFIISPDLWKRYIDFELFIKDNSINIINPPGDDNLCELDTELLTEAYNKLFNNRPEVINYFKYDSGETIYFINFENVLRYHNVSQESINYIKESAERETYLNSILKR